MKKIIYLCAIVLFTAGCKKDFLTTQKNDGFIEGNFWQSQDHAIAGVNGIYQVLTDGTLYGESTPMLMEDLTPNAATNGDPYNVQTISKGLGTSLTNSIFDGRWAADYRGIGRANDLLANVDPIEMDNDLKARIKAEANYLRAVFYFDLMNLYGGVPIVLGQPKPDDQLLPRNTREEVLKQVLADLDLAITVLPLKYSGADVGRVTKGAAMALRARVYLYEGNWTEAAKNAKAVMDLNQYALFPDYRNLFALKNENNSEVLFDVQFKYDPNAQKTNYDLVLERYDYEGPTKNLVDDYYMKDGLPITTSPLYNAASPYENRDPRFAQTIAYPNSTFAGRKVTLTQYPSTGATVKKYTIYDEAKPAVYLTEQQSEINYIYMRYADVLLMYAEAVNEMGMISQADADLSINLVRQRAGMPKITVASQIQMRNEIRHERRIEFFGEGTYYYDIRRWKTAEVEMNADVLDLYGTKKYRHAWNKSRDYLWPIAANVLQYSPQLAQNPGY